jgi:hypothetical protein
MLKILLDEHISPDVGAGLHRRIPELMIRSMAEWQEGDFLGQEDSVCLEEAFVHGLTLVTYDRRTIPPLLKRWAEEVRPHAGVFFVDEKTISPADIGGLVKALAMLVRQTRTWDWANRIVFLRR